MPDPTTDKAWCVLELMGHRKLAGYVSDDAGLTRIDVYVEDPEQLVGDVVQRIGVAPIATQWYGPGAIYCITATTVDACVAFAAAHAISAPIGRWELPAPEPEHEDDVADVELEY